MSLYTRYLCAKGRNEERNGPQNDRRTKGPRFVPFQFRRAPCITSCSSFLPLLLSLFLTMTRQQNSTGHWLRCPVIISKIIGIQSGMNERIGKFKKKISVASARQRRVQGPGLCFLLHPLSLVSCPPYLLHSVRRRFLKGTCTCSASIGAQIHLRYSLRSTSRILPSAIYPCMCVRVHA